MSGLNGRRTLLSYSRMDDCHAEWVEPANEVALAQALKEARAAGRSVTFRASGLSLHDQSLNDDLVISLSQLDGIEVDLDAAEVKVGAAAKWADVVAACRHHELVPYVVPTGEDITCGGSLASDGISRYSPSFGSESVHVQRFDFLAVGWDEPRTLEKPAPDDLTSEDAKLFRAVIGGFGYLGVVTSITYDLLRLDSVGDDLDRNQKVMVTTTLTSHVGFGKLLEEQKRLLLDEVQQELDIDLENWDIPERPDPIKYPSVYAVAFPEGGGRGAVYKSVYSRGDQGPPYRIYQPKAWWRKWLTLLLSSSILKPVINEVVWRSMTWDAGKTFVNEVEDYMFFMEGQVHGKDLYEDLPHRVLPVLQQTFVVPLEHSETFLDRIPGVLEKHDIEPTLLEFLFMPRDRILMSASYEIAGYAITLAFQDIEPEDRQKRAIAAVKELSRVLSDEYGGRLHLTKNVYADEDVLTAMFDGQAQAFMALKSQYDPDGVLRNEFFDRLFAAYV